MFSGYLLVIFITSLLYYYNSSSKSNTPVTITTSAAISKHLDEWIENQQTTSYNIMLGNINPPGTVKGFFAASLSTYNPDYFYTWTRDAALVARVLTHLPETPFSVLEDYVEFQIQSQNTETRCQCLGEPKFNTDGTSYTGSWGRPQNDGPAERAIAFMAIGNRFHHSPEYVNSTLIPAILKDLDYVVDVWQEPCFDLWEEVNGIHFYTLMVMRRALLDGMDFLPIIPAYYKSTVQQIQARIETFWSSQQHYIIATQNVHNGVQRSGLDISILLASNLLASRNDSFFTPGSDKVLATAVALEDAFEALYPLNKQLDKKLGTSIGRYPEDIYDGYGTSVGNPWFIATAAFAELYYLAIKEWKKSGIVINNINRPFFQRMAHHFPKGYYEPGSIELDTLINSTQQSADLFLATIQYHQHKNGSMSEQFDRYIGYMAGARDLTWSHAAVISAIKAKTGKDVIY